jgi:hypothetical protein
MPELGEALGLDEAGVERFLTAFATASRAKPSVAPRSAGDVGHAGWRS